MNKHYWAATLAIPVVTGFCVASNVLANDSTTITVNVLTTSLELDVPSSPAVLTLAPTASGSSFGFIDLTATVGTNNPNGYRLSVDFSDTSLARTAAIGNTTPEIDTLDDLSGGYSEGDFTVNRWGQKVTGDNYFPVPSTSLAPSSWSSTGPVNNAENTITLAAKIDGSIPSGNYEATLTYTLVANPVPTPPGTSGGSINDAGGDNSGQSFAANSLGRAFELAYYTAGYPMYVEDSNVTAPIPGWRPMTDADVSTIGGKEVRFAMQDIGLTFSEGGETHSVCGWAQPDSIDGTYNDQLQVMDKRDGKTYWITKYADGNCWMSQNLDLNLSTNTALVHETSDLGWTNDDSNATWTPDRSTITMNGSSIPGWSTSSTTPYSADQGEKYYVFGTSYDTAASCASGVNMSERECQHYHVGNYYNWTAAIAENNSNTNFYNTEYNVAPNSVCPAGWKMPEGIRNSSTPYTAENSSDVNKLLVTFGILSSYYGPRILISGTYDSNLARMEQAPLYYVRTGGIYTSLYSAGAHIWLRTSTAADSSKSYTFYFYTDGNNYQSYVNNRDSRWDGWPVRCMARQPN